LLLCLSAHSVPNTLLNARYQEMVQLQAREIKDLRAITDKLLATLQEIRAMSDEQKIVQKILTMIQGDYIEKPDFALKSIGAAIDFEHTSATYSCSKARSYWNWFRLWDFAHSPEVILEPNVTPGNCWPFLGHHGQVVIRLARKIYLTNVTIQHIPKAVSLSGNLNAAPKDFAVYGVDDTGEDVFLGAFVFQADSALQTFDLKNKHAKPFGSIKLKITSNWGHPRFTCLYRVRAHGTMGEPETTAC
uniref:SUN domain-containing protein n=1 Tax=Ornithorhynchus anatinus TaxID=9258 RepID=F7BZ98_ORNAN